MTKSSSINRSLRDCIYLVGLAEDIERDRIK